MKKKKLFRTIIGVIASACIWFITRIYLSTVNPAEAPAWLMGVSGGTMAAAILTACFAYLLMSKVPGAETRKVRKVAVNTGAAKAPSEQRTAPAEEASAEDKPVDFRTTAGKTTLDTVAGYETTKKSMQFLVTCLTNKASLRAVGAKMPTGILLYGPPGTGKTLMAKAIAGSAGVPFFSASASDFVEKYVGVGAQRVRQLFADARRSAPCIVFIDELDAVGKSREGNTNDERQQTLNQLLVEMNNLTTEGSNSGIMVIAATNEVENLDAALTRPGRFDRKIAVPLPGMQDRLAILKLHCSGKKLASDVDLNKMALMTENMAGADIATLVNEAAIQAVYHGRSVISAEDMDSALFQMLTGGEKSEVFDERDLAIIAHHEAGHALMLKLITDEIVPQVSVIGSTSGALGVTIHYAAKDVNLLSKKQMEAKIKTLYAGRAAEECFFGNEDDITTGGSDDLKRASQLIYEYLTTYGMSSDSPLNVSAFSGAFDMDVTTEGKNLAKRLYSETLDLLHQHMGSLEAIAATLIERKTINEGELDALVW